MSVIYNRDSIKQEKKTHMFLSWRASRALANAYQQWNGFAMSSTNPLLVDNVKKQIKSHCICRKDGEIVVTETGFVTMAIHTDRATPIGDALVVPGVDDKARRGFMVLRNNAAPYHSLAESAEKAYEESTKSQKRAQALLMQFGNSAKLKSEVRSAPWLMRATSKDMERAGLCRWGTESFLSRLGLLGLARRIGYPCGLLHFAGPYGERLIAARLLRRKYRVGTEPNQETHRVSPQ